jgi:RNA polymerase sigma factor (sigma-70 family)
MRDSDESLLKSFAANRDEAAFRTLADRYLGLIFHTALRRTGSRPLAEEVSQNILCALAKKASSLAKNPDLLPAWLHRATLYESSKAMRSESSHQRRKQLQHPDAISPTAGQASPWSEAVPHLDVALDKLPESDRGILMLHYFESRSFPTIARSLGKNPAAIQKQAQRALEKLARLLRSRGVALSVTAVAAGLTTEFAKAAPAAFLQSATTAVLGGTATYSTTGLTLMTLSKSKAFIPLALLLCAVPLALQQIAISRIQTQNAALRMNLQAENHHSSAARLTPASGWKVSTNTDILVLYDEQKEALRQGRSASDAFAHKLAALDSETLVRLIREGVALPLNRISKGNLLDSLVSALAKSDPRLAVTTAVDLLESDRAAANIFIMMKSLPDHFSAWVDADTQGAKTWLGDLESSGHFNNPRSLKGAFAGTLRGRLVAAMITSHAADLRQYLLTRPEGESYALVGDSVFSLCRSGGTSAASGCAVAIPLMREFIPEPQREDALKRMVGNMGVDSPGNRYSTVTRFFEMAELTPVEKEVIARSAAQLTLGVECIPFDPVFEARAHVETDAFLRKVIPLQADSVLGQVLGLTHQNELERAERIIKGLRENTQASDDQLVESLARSNLRSQLPEALKIAERIKDPTKRAATLDKLNQRQ